MERIADNKNKQELFYRFLVKQGILFQYIEYMKMPLEKVFESDIYDIDLIANMHWWYDLPEGRSYWKNINDNWKNCVKRYERTVLQIPS